MSSTTSDMRVGMKRTHLSGRTSPDGSASPVYPAGAAVEVFFRSCHTPDGSFPVTSYAAALGGQPAKTRAETQPSVSPTRGRSSAAAYDVTGKDPSGVWHERKKTSTAAPAG